MIRILKRIFNFYLEGFKTLSPYAKSLWIIIFLKLFVMFFVLKLFFFQDTLENRFNSNEEITEFVIDQITNTN